MAETLTDEKTLRALAELEARPRHSPIDEKPAKGLELCLWRRARSDHVRPREGPAVVGPSDLREQSESSCAAAPAGQQPSVLEDRPGRELQSAVAPIEPDEVRPGLVAFLEVDVLAADERVVNTKDPRHGIRPGPFLCLSADEETSQRAQITTEYRPERVEIRPKWRTGGHPQWLRDPQYLQDGAGVWRGPLEVFLEAPPPALTHGPPQTPPSWTLPPGAEILGMSRRQKEREGPER